MQEEKEYSNLITEVSAELGDDVQNSNFDESQVNEYNNDDKNFHERAKPHVHKICLWAIYIAFGLFISILIIRVWHLCTPDNLRWLDSDDIAIIDKFFTGGGIGLFIGVFKEQISAILKK